MKFSVRWSLVRIQECYRREFGRLVTILCRLSLFRTLLTTSTHLTCLTLYRILRCFKGVCESFHFSFTRAFR